jgi:hypothetical protein
LPEKLPASNSIGVLLNNKRCTFCVGDLLW